MIIGISNGKQYKLHDYNLAGGCFGLCNVEGIRWPVWCTFEKIYVDGILMENNHDTQ